jgi:hypothetical protein
MIKTVLSLFAICLLLGAAGAAAHAGPALPPTDTAVHWTGAGGATQVFLMQNPQDPKNPYRLLVAGGGDLKVVYRTQINSTTGVRKELQPKEPLVSGLREYDIPHKFSRMTIWMALEFLRGEARDNELTRTFSGSIGTVVPNDEYLKDKGEK